MKTDRQNKILEIVSKASIETQDELIVALAEEGFHVTQATISRDIRELKLLKVLASTGNYQYVAPKIEEAPMCMKFSKALVDSVVSVEYAMNLVVVRTFPGLANAVAAGIDSLSIEEVLGCVAGDDTIFVAARTEEAAKGISERLHLLMQED